MTTAFRTASALRRQAVLHSVPCEGSKAVEGYRTPKPLREWVVANPCQEWLNRFRHFFHATQIRATTFAIAQGRRWAESAGHAQGNDRPWRDRRPLRLRHCRQI